MTRKIFIAGFLIFIVLFFAYWAAMFTGPHMRYQAHIRSFDQPMPLPPPGMVTVEPDERTAPSPAESKQMRNPLAPTPENIETGKIYYGYYCSFCHDDKGQGNGPVGQSYMPKPADLQQADIQDMGDGRLFAAMLLGPGHEPVMERIVQPSHRWYLVLYVRALGRQAAPASSR